MLLLTLTSAADSGAYEMGLKLYANGDYKASARYFLVAASQTDSNPNAHYYLADAYMKLNRLSDAQAEYLKILAIAPDTQAGRLSRLALTRLHEYLDETAAERWRTSNRAGSKDLPDLYTGPGANGDDYLSEITEGGKRIRWSLSKMPIKLYIESSPLGIRNFKPGFISQVRRAMDIWTGVLNHQLSYVLVNSKDQADIQVTWTNTIDTQGRSGDGKTAYTAGLMLPHIRNEQIEHMEVKLATFDIQGRPQDDNTIYAVAIHELGHSLGLMGHSENPQDIMYSKNQQIIQPSIRDSNTLRRLYTAEADINNLPASDRVRDPHREKELNETLDATIGKLEARTQKNGMALDWLNLGVAYFQKGKRLESEHLTATKPEKNSTESFWFEKAMKVTSQAIALEPRDPRAYHKRSLIAQELNLYPQALQDIRQAISLDRQDAEYYMLQSWYLAKLGMMGEARSSLDTYLIYKPNQANASDVQRIRDLLSPVHKSQPE